jgi:hypothetical protein
LFFNVSAIFIALALYESFLWFTKSDTQKDKGYNTGTYSRKDYYRPSPTLGYMPVANGVFTSIKHTSEGRQVYNVQYTFKNGVRLTPNSDENSTKSAFFLGCSVTFGEGVSDSQTLPYYFNERARDKYRVLNYGFHGYGTHQMHAALESMANDGSLKKGGKGSIVIYSLIPDHIRRCAGYNSWDKYGPRYEVESGILIRKGNFNPKDKTIAENCLLVKLWHSSYTYKVNFSPEAKKATHYDVIRALAVISEANKIVVESGLSFKLIVWNYRSKVERIDDDELDFFYRELKKAPFQVFFVNDTISPVQYQKEVDSLSIKNDGHPTSKFYQTVAGYVCNHMEE